MKKHIQTALFVSVLFSSILTFGEEPKKAQEPVVTTPSTETSQNLATEFTVGFDMVSYSKVNVEGGFGLMAGAKQYIYFHEYVGVFFGADYFGRKMTLNSSLTTGWLDIPFGLSFRYKWMSTLQNYLSLGAFYALPLGDFQDSGGTVPLQGGIGLILNGGTYFPISPSFELGVVGDIRFSFFSPFKAITTSSFLNAGIGLAARIKY